VAPRVLGLHLLIPPVTPFTLAGATEPVAGGHRAHVEALNVVLLLAAVTDEPVEGAFDGGADGARGPEGGVLVVALGGAV